MKKLRVCIATAILSAYATGAFARGSDFLPGDWVRLADGVYQQTDVDGTVSRIAYGNGGARYERTLLAGKIRSLANKAANNNATDEDMTSLFDLQGALEKIPEKARGSVVPMSATRGNLCTVYPYAFDSHFAVGDIGATTIARGWVTNPDFGPVPPITSAAQYASVSVTPFNKPAISSTSTNAGGTTVSAIVNWTPNTLNTGNIIGSASCTGSSYAYVSITSNQCAGGTAFISQSKSYSQCITAP